VFGGGVGRFPLGTWELEVGSYCVEHVMHYLSIRPDCVQIVNEHYVGEDEFFFLNVCP